MAIIGRNPIMPRVFTKNPRTIEMTMKNTVQLNVNLSLYTNALRLAAIAIVVTPVHEKKNTEDIIKIKAFKNWYL